MNDGGRTPRVAIAALACAVLGTPAVASANGRFPQATQLSVDPSNPSRLVVRTTFGLLRSEDGGATWRWLCEEVVGYGGTFDPAIALTGAGTLVVGLPDGVSRSGDLGCSWSKSPALEKNWVVDVASDRLDAHHVVAIDAPIELAAPGFQAFVAHSRDDGATWTLAAARLPEDMVPTTVDLAPSRPERLYASGVGAFRAFASVVRSDDGGATWTESTFDMHGARAPYLAGVDPLDPERVWLRLDGDDRDVLLLSKNGGQRFDEVTAATELLGFAASPDGTRIAVGGPSDGLSIASTSDLVFTKPSAVHVRCLAWTKDGLWACGDDALDGFALGFSTDGGKTFAPRLRLRDLQPLGCVNDACAKAWVSVSAQLASKPDAGVDGSSTDGASEQASATGGGCQATRRRVGAPWLLIAWPMLRWRRARRRSAPCPQAASSSL